MDLKKPLFLILFVTAVILSCSESTYKIDPNNVVTVRLQSKVNVINPLVARSSNERRINKQIFLTLTDFDPITLKESPVLVKTLPTETPIVEGPLKGGIKYTFELLQNATWADGSPITGNDLSFTIKSILNPKAPTQRARQMLIYMDLFEIDPDNPRRFHISTDEEYMLAKTVAGLIPVIPQKDFDPQGLMNQFSIEQLKDSEYMKSLEGKDTTLTHLATYFTDSEKLRDIKYNIGSGPYKLVSWASDNTITLDRTENWWGNQYQDQRSNLSAFPSKIIFKVIPEENTALTMIKDDQLDAVGTITARKFVEMQENEAFDDQLDFYTPAILKYAYFGLNNQSPKLSDKRVRRAVAHLMDVDKLITTILKGLAKRAVGPLHPDMDDFDQSMLPIPFDPEKAKSLLEEAGWTDTNGNNVVDKLIDGKRVELEIVLMIQPGSETARDAALLFQDGAAKAGVKITPEMSDMASVMIPNMRKRNYDAYMLAVHMSIAPYDPMNTWHSDSDSEEGGNYVSFRSPEADRAIEAIRSTLDKTERAIHYKTFQNIVYDEQPIVFLYAEKERIIIDSDFETTVSIKRPHLFENLFVYKGIGEALTGN